MSKVSSFFFIFTFLLIHLCGCQDPIDQQTLDEMKSKVSNLSSQIAPIAGSISEKATDGAQAVFKIEYRVETIQTPYSGQTVERRLNELGAERWDCFSILQTQDGIRITCKKIPYSMIRSLIGAM
jgi:hypothetical protein